MLDDVRIRGPPRDRVQAASQRLKTAPRLGGAIWIRLQIVYQPQEESFLR